MVQAGAVEGADDSTVEHHGDAVAEGQHLVEILGDEEHGEPGVAGRHQPGMDVLGGPDVDAAGRLRGEQDPSRRRHLPAP